MRWNLTGDKLLAELAVIVELAQTVDPDELPSETAAEVVTRLQDLGEVE